MYVLVLSGGIPSDKYIGHGIFEFDQAKALAKTGCKVVFAVADIRSLRRWRKWGVERYDREGVHVVRVNIPGGRLPRGVQNSLTKLALRILYPIILKEFGKPDVVHAHFTALGYAAACLKEKLGVPFVITEHSSGMLEIPINGKLRSMAERAYNIADRVIAVSPALAEVIKGNFDVEAEYIPNVVDTSLFSYSPERTQAGFRLISVGNLIESKRMALTIEAFAKAFGDVPEASLCIIGEGPGRVRLEAMITTLGQEGKITLMGARPREAIAEEMKRCDCFVLPSHHETFGVVYIEALASGLPVIATRCGGPEHFINEGNGLLIPVDDCQALAQAMKYTSENIRSYDGSRIAEEARGLFSPEALVARLKNTYAKVVV